MLYSTITVALYCAVRGIPFTFDARPAYLMSLAYLALFGSVIAFVGYLTLIQRVGAARAGYTSVVIPLLAMTTSTLFEGYRWSALALTGMALVVGGGLLVVRGKRATRGAGAPA
jgi:drug/metabolite transporter (DMT)-like permease